MKSEPATVDRLDRDRAVTVARGLVVGLGAVSAGLVLWVVGSRFAHPVDGEWMVGAVRDAVGRLRDGQPMYLAPNETFIPFIYPPLYHYACALLARVFSVFVACKLVSLAATGALAWAIVEVSRTLGASRFWAFVGVLLHVGAYSMTLMFYDLERVDAFAAAVVALALVALLGGESRARTAIAGVLLGLAFFAKQPHILALGACAVALFAAGERRRALTVSAIAAVTFGAVFAYLEITTHGWFRFFCVSLPGKHGFDPRVLSTFFIVDLPKGLVLATASLGVGLPVLASLVRRLRGGKEELPPWREVLFAVVVLTTMAEAFFLRAHRGGWSNVIIAWTPFGCMAAAVACSRLEARAAGTPVARAVSLILLAGVGLELLGGFFDPGDNGPNADDVAERGRLVALVRELETRGDVVVTPTANLTKTPHFHIAALYDLLRAGMKLPPDLAAAIGERRYAAILVGRPMELLVDETNDDEAFELFASNYFVAARREERDRSGMSGFDGRPRWVMLPRKHPLAGLHKPELERRLQAEMGLAEANLRAQPVATNPTIDESIEDRAAPR